MHQALSLLPDPDLVEILVEESMPLFILWCFALAIVLVGFVLFEMGWWIRLRRSPVERMLRRRLG